jgi:hypothetical protein
MTEAILIVSGLVLGAICLGVGYLLGKKKKVEDQVKAEIERIKAQGEAILKIAKG